MAISAERAPLLKPSPPQLPSCSDSCSQASALLSETTAYPDDDSIEDSGQLADDNDLKSGLDRQHVAKTISVLLMGTTSFQILNLDTRLT